MILFKNLAQSILVIQQRRQVDYVVGSLVKSQPDGDWTLEVQEVWTGREALDIHEKRAIVLMLDKLNGWDFRPIEMIRREWERITGRDTYR